MFTQCFQPNKGGKISTVFIEKRPDAPLNGRFGAFFGRPDQKKDIWLVSGISPKAPRARSVSMCV